VVLNFREFEILLIMPVICRNSDILTVIAFSFSHAIVQPK